MRILICDDEPAMVKQISEIIADAYPDIELVGVHSSAELSEKLAPEDANRKFDLAFLDIAVSDESGVDIALSNILTYALQISTSSIPTNLGTLRSKS